MRRFSFPGGSLVAGHSWVVAKLETSVLSNSTNSASGSESVPASEWASEPEPALLKKEAAEGNRRNKSDVATPTSLPGVSAVPLFPGGIIVVIVSTFDDRRRVLGPGRKLNVLLLVVISSGGFWSVAKSSKSSKPSGMGATMLDRRIPAGLPPRPRPRAFERTAASVLYAH